MVVERWRELTRHDARELQEWICTDPPKRSYVPGRGRTHPKPWELDVQSYFRNSECFRSGLVWAGYDHEGLAAVAQISLDVPDDSAFINAASRAQRLCGQGIGDELVTECIRLVSGGSPRVAASAIGGLVDPGNHACKAMLSRHGFTYEAKDGDLEYWARLLE